MSGSLNELPKTLTRLIDELHARIAELEQELTENEGVIKLLRRQRDDAERALDLLRGKDPLDKFTGTR